ncbi:hypothetical protein [Teredinibacter sp. KSP-S5-2]|uniref:hypothetical protein n=1 Tax=Teredinibacter sp. KSP-S5-2 TaxID=3034506 RepID=UPI002934F459|nr:hypothetical protein [Teredinibacter sp. KSP-S5-2]WNO10689.1 hypothetical protein P5V12_05825 [Teredinibacter sp. KSP-S5-2]
MTDMNLVLSTLSHAQSISSRAAFAWLITDKNNRALSHDAVIAGFNQKQILNEIAKYKNQAEKLFLSIEPLSTIIDIDQLIETITSSNIREITLGNTLPDKLSDNRWRQWLTTWQGKIHTMPFNSTIERISYGINEVLHNQKPWVTCVTAATIAGREIKLSSLSNEFGFSSYLDELIKQSGVLMYTSDQAMIIDSLNLVNNMGKAIEIIEILSLDTLNSILRQCAERQRFNVVILSNLQALAHLLENNLIDEAIHHIGHTQLDYEGNSTTTHAPLDLIALNNWNLAASDIVGECSRLTFCRKTPVNDSRHWAN